MTVRYAPVSGSTIEKTGAPIWDNLYAVRVPYVETLSEQMIKDFGMPTLGNRALDRQMHSDLVNVVISINAIVEYFKRGVTVYMQNNDDVNEIYNIVNNYLLAWKQQIDNCLNMGNIPTEDLLLLDRFAEMLYPVAAAYGAPPRAMGTLFESFYTNNGRFASRSAMFEPPAPAGEPAAGKHLSVGGELAKAIASLKNQWN